MIANNFALSSFLPRDAMQERTMASCGVPLSVRPIVTFVNSVKTNKHITFKLFTARVATPLWFFSTKRHGNIPTGSILTGAWNAGVVGRWQVDDTYRW